LEAAGALPQGWVKARLGQLVPLQRGFDLPARVVQAGPFPVIYSNGVLRRHDRYMVKGPGVVTGRSGTIGRVHFVTEDFWPHNTTLWATSFDAVVPRFAFYLLQYLRIERLASGSGVPTLNRNDVHSLEVSVPRDKREQAAIADLLDDFDRQLVALQRLFAKKEAVRKGMLQRLVTGNGRLRGFSGGWRTMRFCDLALLAQERVDPRRVDPTTLLIDLDCIESGSGRLRSKLTAGHATSLKSSFQAGDVLFGKLRAYLRKFWLADSSGLCSTELWALRSNSPAIGPYVRYLVETERFIEVASGGYGTHMPRADWGMLELAALKARLGKLEAIRQGVMQELLSGRRRL
jgi:type I restriction enzyme S subunit